MEFIKGISFTNFSACRGNYDTQESRKALRCAKDSLGLTHVTLCFLAFQENAHSEEIDFHGTTTPNTK